MHDRFLPKKLRKIPITIRLAPDRIEQLDALALELDISRSEMIAQCIDFALNNLLLPEEHKDIQSI